MYLDLIVDYVNAHLKSRMGAKASNSRFYGVCDLVEKDVSGEKQIVLYDNFGNDEVTIDDTYSLIVYNRFLGWSLQSNETNAVHSFGDGASYKTAFANFTMGVYGDRKRLGMTPQELTASMVFNFPDVLPISLTSQLRGLKQSISSPLSTNNNTARQSEGVTLPQEHIFFTISYRISVSGDTTCLSDCEPDCI